jgi:calcineurin-like phosphoesterase family protein
MKKWITSDLHFGHANILRFCPETRGRFTDVDDMREKMIAEWNQDVKPEDEVFVLGDFAFLPAKDAVAILRRLNGSKILVEGNHDRKLLNDPSFRREFKEVHQYLRYNHDGTVVIMCHYPFHFEWDQAHRGSVHFYGHVHGKKTGLEDYRARDVAFDATGKVVSNFDMMIADALKGKIPDHH